MAQYQPGLQRVYNDGFNNNINAVAHANTILLLSENNNNNNLPSIDHEYISATPKGDWLVVNCRMKGDGAEFLYQHRSSPPLQLNYFFLHFTIL